jgi:hypothetical protein
MFPEDSVLVGVINSRRDFRFARDDHWYRIPQGIMPRGVRADYLAFFLSGGVFRDRRGTIPCFARVTGFELAYRRDLIPAQPNHPRADNVYYRVALDELQTKDPPIRNTTRRSFSFIYTTWDRFVAARTIGDLYSKGDHYVDRIYYALHDLSGRPARLADAERRRESWKQPGEF